jgi:uncharacterized protein YndB with AHSA1/START domain
MAEQDAGSGLDCEMVVRRMVDAPQDRVFDAFTDRAHIGQWWGPNGFSADTGEMDVRVGGAWRFTMQGADGSEYRNVVRYTAVEPPSRLCFEHGDDVSVQFRAEVSFEGQGGATLVTLRVVCDTARQLQDMKTAGAEEGARQTLERLGRYLAGYGSEM